MLCEIVYILTILVIGSLLGGKIEIPITHLFMCILNTILVIIVYCSIYNLITMLCIEIAVSIVICTIMFVLNFVLAASIGYIANYPKYATHSYWENGEEYIISQEINPNYPGDEKVKIAKTIYSILPQGQANKIENREIEGINQRIIYSIVLISIINTSGIYLFSKKELK